MTANVKMKKYLTRTATSASIGMLPNGVCARVQVAQMPNAVDGVHCQNIDASTDPRNPHTNVSAQKAGGDQNYPDVGAPYNVGPIHLHTQSARWNGVATRRLTMMKSEIIASATVSEFLMRDGAVATSA